MIVSLRTLINTTLFWILLFFGFWLYTKYDPTPAKELLHFIGWDNLGNITITDEKCQSQTTVGSLSNQLIAERLTNIEQLCTKSIRLSIYDEVPTIAIQQPVYTQTLPTNNSNFTANPLPNNTGSTVRIIENKILSTGGSLQL